MARGGRDGSVAARGVYLAHDVGRLAGVSGERIGQWARFGYIRSSHRSRAPRLYAYQDAAEAMVVHDLISRGVPLTEVGRAVELLAPEHGRWPLSSADLATSDGEVFVRRRGRPFTLGRRPWHGVLEVSRLERVAKDLDRGGWAARLVPGLRHIEVDPERLSGRPTIRGRRVSAESVARLAGAEDGERLLRSAYGLRAEQVRDAVRWWQAVLTFEEG